MLDTPECRQLLAVAARDTGFGRIGIPTDQAPLVVPVNFELHDHHVVVRVGPGFLADSAGDRLVAFEVDHVDTAAGVAWSVLVRGLATLIGDPTGRDLAGAPHPLVPEPGQLILTIRPDVVTGRRFEFPPAA